MKRQLAILLLLCVLAPSADAGWVFNPFTGRLDYTASGSGGTPAGSSGDWQINSSGSFGAVSGPAVTNVLAAAASSPVGTQTNYFPIAGVSCRKSVVTNSDISTAALTVEKNLFIIPAGFVFTSSNVIAEGSTAFSGNAGTLSVSLQQSGNTTSPDIVPVFPLKVGASNFWTGMPGNPNLSSYTMTAYFTSSSGNLSTVSAGSLTVRVCGYVEP